MARIQLDKGDMNFLDILLTSQPEGFGAVVTLKIPKGEGRSGIVLYREIAFGKDHAVAARFIEDMFGPPANQNRPQKPLNIFFRPVSDETVDLEVDWYDESGRIAFSRDMPRERVLKFRKILESVCRSISSRSACRKH